MGIDSRALGEVSKSVKLGVLKWPRAPQPAPLVSTLNGLQHAVGPAAPLQAWRRLLVKLTSSSFSHLWTFNSV